MLEVVFLIRITFGGLFLTVKGFLVHLVTYSASIKRYSKFSLQECPLEMPNRVVCMISAIESVFRIRSLRESILSGSY